MNKARECEGCEAACPTPTDTNAEAWEVFQACSTQWRCAGMEGIRYALDYAAVDAVRAGYGFVGNGDFWARVRLLEKEALEIWWEERDQNG